MIPAFPRKFASALITAFTLATATSAANAGTIHLSFSGDNASGSFGSGASFANQSWTLEYALDDTAANVGSGNNASFEAILGGTLEIGSDQYTLDGDSITGRVHLSNNSQYSGINVNPTSGGFMQFIVNADELYPALFSDLTDLATANLGTTLTNDTTDSFNNTSYLNYQSRPAYPWDPTSGSPGVDLVGDTVSIYANTPAASGNWSISVSGTSAFAGNASPAVVSEPASLGLLLLPVALMVMRHKR